MSCRSIAPALGCRNASLIACVILLVVASDRTHAQAGAIPVIPVASPVVSTERFRVQPNVRQLPDGRVLANDAAGKRLLVFDSTLARFTVSADSANSGGVLYPASPIRVPLIAYAGDSTLLLDFAARAFLILDPSGRVSRTAAPPNPADITNFSSGLPGLDAAGRLIYRGNSTAALRPQNPVATSTPAPTADTVAVVRADFDTRSVDTIAHFVTPRFTGTEFVEGADGTTTGRLRVNPVPPAADDWAVMSDGTLAIVRAHDYHIDFVGADRVLMPSAKLPFDWKRRVMMTNSRASIP